jgi:hypothetical protein
MALRASLELNLLKKEHTCGIGHRDAHNVVFGLGAFDRSAMESHYQLSLLAPLKL